MFFTFLTFKVKKNKIKLEKEEQLRYGSGPQDKGSHAFAAETSIIICVTRTTFLHVAHLIRSHISKSYYRYDKLKTIVLQVSYMHHTRLLKTSISNHSSS